MATALDDSELSYQELDISTGHPVEVGEIVSAMR